MPYSNQVTGNHLFIIADEPAIKAEMSAYHPKALHAALYE